MSQPEVRSEFATRRIGELDNVRCRGVGISDEPICNNLPPPPFSAPSYVAVVMSQRCATELCSTN